MSSKLYNPKNQWGKTLVPVDTPKSKTGTPDNEYIDASWFDTADSLEELEDKKLVSSEALKDINERFAQNQEEHEQLKNDIKQNNLLTGAVAEHVAELKTSLQETSQTIKDIEQQVETNTHQVEDAVEKAKAAEEATKEIQKEIESIGQGQVTQKTLTVTITEGESEEIDWKDGTTLLSCNVNTDFFIPRVSILGGGKAKLIFFSPSKQPENFSAPRNATVVLLQPTF